MAGRQPSRLVGDTQCLVHERLEVPFDIEKFFVQMAVCAASPRAAAALEPSAHTSQVALRLRTAVVVKKISRSGCCFGESSVF